jgi:hypothetical protein
MSMVSNARNVVIGELSKALHAARAAAAALHAVAGGLAAGGHHFAADCARTLAETWHATGDEAARDRQRLLARAAPPDEEDEYGAGDGAPVLPDGTPGEGGAAADVPAAGG